MQRPTRLIAVALSCTVLLGIGLIILTYMGDGKAEPTNAWIVEGTIVRLERPYGIVWGLDSEFDWRHPFRPQKLRLEGLPIAYQIKGAKVSCECQFLEHIGSGDWDTIVKPLSVLTLGIEGSDSAASHRN